MRNALFRSKLHLAQPEKKYITFDQYIIACKLIDIV